MTSGERAVAHFKEYRLLNIASNKSTICFAWYFLFRTTLLVCFVINARMDSSIWQGVTPKDAQVVCAWELLKTAPAQDSLEKR